MPRTPGVGSLITSLEFMEVLEKDYPGQENAYLRWEILKRDFLSRRQRTAKLMEYRNKKRGLKDGK